MAKTLYFCEGCIGSPATGKTDLIKIFNAIRPESYPHVHRDLVVCSRLSGGLGPVQFFVELRKVNASDLIHVSNTFTLRFPARDHTMELALTCPNILFPEPGI